jgi:hypothetical protein
VPKNGKLFGARGKDSRYLHTICRHLARMEAKDRALLMLAEGAGKRQRPAGRQASPVGLVCEKRLRPSRRSFWVKQLGSLFTTALQEQARFEIRVHLPLGALGVTQLGSSRAILFVGSMAAEAERHGGAYRAA